MKSNKHHPDFTVNDFFEAMSRIATTVNVVTTDGPAGRAGITVSAMSSVTAEPPTLLVCIHEISPTSAMINENGKFCVNVLNQDQRELSEVFAGRAEIGGLEHFKTSEWDFESFQSPLFPKSLAAFDCIVSQQVKVGTHTIFFGEVQQTFLGSGQPLVYVDRNYQD